MSVFEHERQRAVQARDALFRDPGAGVFAGAPRDFALAEAGTNLGRRAKGCARLFQG